MRTERSYCRFCHAYCPLEVDVEGGRVVAVRGDASNSMYGGYTCLKGRELPSALGHPERIRNALRRRADGSFEEIPLTRALDEIAERIGAIVKKLRDAQRRGLQLIVVDPRRSELARRAQLHLQVRPGEDPTLLAALLNVILGEAFHDQGFCAEHVDGVDALRAAVEPFTPAYAEARSEVPADQLVAAARLFAAGPRGVASAGTGPDMAPHPNLTEHLVLALNTVCGRYNRPGERVPNPGVLGRATPRRAQALPPRTNLRRGAESRVRGLGDVIGEMPAAALSDEILLPGEGQVRALLSIGGNPVAARPDQVKTLRAMRALELLVCVDIKLSATARLADYVIPPKMCLERADVTLLTDSWYDPPYSQYTEAVVEPGFPALEEWELYWELASRLGTPIDLAAGGLDLGTRPTKFEVLEKIVAGSRVPLAEVRERARGGRIFDEVEVVVEPREEGWTGRLHVGPRDLMEELALVRRESPVDPGFTHRLISRRMLHVYNSSGRDLDASRRRGTTNPAFMNPGDLDRLGIRTGDLVEIDSGHAKIVGVAEATEELRSGVVSMAHAWGDAPENDARVREIGASTNRLVDNASGFDPISGMARQSAIPVRLRAVPGL